MCTLTYLPTNNGFIVTQNRDESPLRGKPIFPYKSESPLAHYPKDPDGDGTWMAATKDTVVCVLNGAYEPHERHLPYKHSRGLLPLLILNRPNHELKLSDAEELEPFSVFIFNSKYVRRYTWDAEDLYLEEFSPSDRHIFQSAPLYSPAMQSLRSDWFFNWSIIHPTPHPKDILEFHLLGGEGNGETDICMYRPGVQTTAITQVVCTPLSTTYSYRNLLSDEEGEISF
ncbi:MAG: hypothetical protein EP346_07655 [Bacteroidetes bacterium]|nr:MAG: hypothetical protein EP346_07655 [Bacteroidota bacterium]